VKPWHNPDLKHAWAAGILQIFFQHSAEHTNILAQWGQGNPRYIWIRPCSPSEFAASDCTLPMADQVKLLHRWLVWAQIDGTGKSRLRWQIGCWRRPPWGGGVESGPDCLGCLLWSGAPIQGPLKQGHWRGQSLEGRSGSTATSLQQINDNVHERLRLVASSLARSSLSLRYLENHWAYLPCSISNDVLSLTRAKGSSWKPDVVLDRWLGKQLWNLELRSIPQQIRHSSPWWSEFKWTSFWCICFAPGQALGSPLWNYQLWCLGPSGIWLISEES